MSAGIGACVAAPGAAGFSGALVAVDRDPLVAVAVAVLPVRDGVGAFRTESGRGAPVLSAGFGGAGFDCASGLAHAT
ncbi:MAG TPA: hypothetical protein VHB25_00770, partial [Gemmatimonadaceae bacterium]|nr:hypothetical protein [Gemmatimonadaceae bacterium]